MTTERKEFWQKFISNISYVLEFVQNKEVYNNEDFIECYSDIPDINSYEIRFIKRLQKISFFDFFYNNMGKSISLESLNSLKNTFNKEFVEEYKIDIAILRKICKIYMIKVESELKIKEDNDPIIKYEIIHTVYKNEDIIPDAKTEANSSSSQHVSSIPVSPPKAIYIIPQKGKIPFFKLLTLLVLSLILAVVILPSPRSYVFGVYNYTSKNYQNAILDFEKSPDFLNTNELLTKSHLSNFSINFPNTESSFSSAQYLLKRDYSDIDNMIKSKTYETIDIFRNDYQSSQQLANQICTTLDREDICEVIIEYIIKIMIEDEEFELALKYLEASKYNIKSLTEFLYFRWGEKLFNESRFEEALVKFINNPDHSLSISYIEQINEQLKWSIKDSSVENDEGNNINFAIGDIVSYRGHLSGGKENDSTDVKVSLFKNENELYIEHIYYGETRTSYIYLGLQLSETTEFGTYTYSISVFEDNKWEEIDRISFYYGN